jgi:hypothetical protein
MSIKIGKTIKGAISAPLLFLAIKNSLELYKPKSSSCA